MSNLLRLLQLASPTLPVGAYSYSEGLEALVAQKKIDNSEKLCYWIEQELDYGAIRIETAVMLRGYTCFQHGDVAGLNAWNAWLSAARETEELRQQSWQMGRSLFRLLSELQPELQSLQVDSPCHYAIAFGIAAAVWNIDKRSAISGYLSSWASNLINGGVKLIPLGQTTGQQILFSLHPLLTKATETILTLQDEDLESCNFGLTLASMSHETLYSRLFRS